VVGAAPHGARQVIRARMMLPDSLASLPAALAAAGVSEGGAEHGLVFGPEADSPASWSQVRESLAACFTATQQAAEAGAPIVYLIAQPALLGGRGPCPGMLAGALVSGVRALAMEGARTNLRVNGLTYDEETDAAWIARWIRALLELEGVSGDVVDLGVGHHGKVRP
jgi:hypothetical protein